MYVYKQKSLIHHKWSILEHMHFRIWRSMFIGRQKTGDIEIDEQITIWITLHLLFCSSVFFVLLSDIYTKWMLMKVQLQIFRLPIAWDSMFYFMVWWVWRTSSSFGLLDCSWKKCTRKAILPISHVRSCFYLFFWREYVRHSRRKIKKKRLNCNKSNWVLIRNGTVLVQRIK